MTDFTPILNLTLHIIMLLPKNKCKKKKESLSGCHLFFFFATSISTQDMHFHPTARKLYLNKLTLTVCLRNARTTYFIFRNDYLQPFQEGLKEEKEKKKPEAARRKSYPIRPMTSKLRHTDINSSSSRRIDVSTTLFDVLHLLEYY